MVVFEDPNANLDFCQMISSSLDCFLINFLQPNVARQQYNSYWIMKIQAHNEVTPTVWVLPSTVEFIHQKLSKAVNRHPPPFICIWTLRLQFLQHLLHLQIYFKKKYQPVLVLSLVKISTLQDVMKSKKKFNLCCTKLFNSWEIFLFARRSCF